jgi:hypothetical protein
VRFSEPLLIEQQGGGDMKINTRGIKRILPLISLVILSLYGCAGMTSSTNGGKGVTQLGPDIKMDKSELGFLYLSEDGSIFFCENQIIPLKENTFFGWRVHLITNKEKVTWKEVFILPGSPSIWGYMKGTEVDPQGKVATTEKTVSPQNGWIGHGWFAAPGDPPGNYKIEIYIEGVLAKTFTFEMKPPH